MAQCCVCCERGTEVGALCRDCALQVAPCEGLIPDHIRSTTDQEAAWLIDGFGHGHALAPLSVIGRDYARHIVVLQDSVSREHAELKKTDRGWQIRDLGSHNGTFVDKVRCQGRSILPERAIIKVGHVSVWFLSAVNEQPAQPRSMATKNADDGVVRYLLTHAEVEMCVVGGADLTTGGSLLSRAKGSGDWAKPMELPPLEFQLLRALCTAAHSEADSPSTARGCIPTRQLARDLPFRGPYADEENVRQVVKRLRDALKEVGAAGVLSVVPGRGYYLGCDVAIAQR